MSFPSRYSDSFLQGELFLHRGDHKMARRLFERALEEERLIADPARLAPVLLNLGSITAVEGESERARGYFQEVLSLLKKAPNDKLAGQALVNLGNLSRELGESRRARAYYLEAADLLEAASDDASLGTVHCNLALLEKKEGNFHQTIKSLKKALELHKKSGREEGLAATWGQLGRTYIEIGKDREAETCFNYAATHFAQLGHPEGEAEALRCLADIYERGNDPESALLCMKRVLETHQRFGNSSDKERDQRRLDRLRRLKNAGRTSEKRSDRA